MRQTQAGPVNFLGVSLAMLPLGSFLLQYALSLIGETELLLFQHLTVTYVDWVFVPFNYLVADIIDWQRGKTLFGLTLLAVVLSVATHAFWQYHLGEGGYMLTREHVMLPAGWVHLGFSVVQMTLLLAFIFIRRPSPRFLLAATLLAVSYFVAAGICGYVMNNGFMITDVFMVVLGLFFVVVYPRLQQPTAI
jgi:hypothetical protein